MKRLAWLGIALSLITQTALAGGKPAVYSNRDGAIRGYDPVAYFTDGEPVKGSREFRYRWKDADWLFSSQEHVDLFRASPEQYAPQYGGYCAYAMSKGKYASGSPQAWTVHEGKLYLNFSKGVRKTWSKNIPEYIERADRNWQQLRTAG